MPRGDTMARSKDEVYQEWKKYAEWATDARIKSKSWWYVLTFRSDSQMEWALTCAYRAVWYKNAYETYDERHKDG